MTEEGSNSNPGLIPPPPPSNPGPVPPPAPPPGWQMATPGVFPGPPSYTPGPPVPPANPYFLPGQMPPYGMPPPGMPPTMHPQMPGMAPGHGMHPGTYPPVLVTTEKKSNKALWWTLGIIGGLLLLFCGLPIVGSMIFVGYVGAVAPPTHAVSGPAVRPRDLEAINKMNLLQPGEKIRYFYSPAIMDLKEGVFFTTDSRVVLYCELWTPPMVSVGYGEITDMDVAWGKGVMDVTDVTLYLEDGGEVYIQLSPELGGDKQFYNDMRARWREVVGGGIEG